MISGIQWIISILYDEGVLLRATIEVNGHRATFEGEEWSGEDEELVRLLNFMLRRSQISGYDPAPHTNEAKRVAKLLGGKVIDYELPEYVEGRVY